MPRTLVELRMCALSASLRDKPLWWEKRLDKNITGKWQREALDAGFTINQWTYVLAELEGYALQRDTRTGIQVSCYDRVWQSDELVSNELSEALRAEVAELEDVPDEEKDWHPGSNGQVLDLVHPSLYPLVYGRTLVGDSLAQVPEDFTLVEDWWGEKTLSTFSTRFQWLPTDFAISNGNVAQALGYINNVHSTNTGLVSVVERLVAAFVPLWDRVLTDQLEENNVDLFIDNMERWRMMHPITWDPETNKVVELPANRSVGTKSNFPPRATWCYDRDETLPGCPTDRDAVDYFERWQAWWDTLPILAVPVEPYSGRVHERNRRYSLDGRRIQVIVKLANIVLTPENPVYRGGSWHVEGMRNENIVASGIYYYDEENVTTSRLAFRIAVSEPDYRQNDNAGTKLNFGLENGKELAQQVGSVITKQGRCIAFPNYYQHQVQPFELKDSSKPGHRKIVALFLVDPSEPIPSTSVVTVQQSEWLGDLLSGCGPETRLYKLPREIIDVIAEDVSGTMTKTEALEYRLQLMDERRAFVQSVNSEYGYFGATFDLCEH